MYYMDTYCTPIIILTLFSLLNTHTKYTLGMQEASKTYVEKRSWFHPLLNLHRIFEWHCVTFTLLASWAFASQLVWDLAYTLKIVSFVFWEITLLNIMWTALEVWLLIPNATIPGPSKCGYLIRLLAG